MMQAKEVLALTGREEKPASVSGRGRLLFVKLGRDADRRRS